MTDTIIEVENLGKRYVLDHQRQREKYTALRDVIAQGVKSALKGFGGKKTETKEEFWALKDVSFQVKRGEVVGIIGRNGAGKSTLLKILSRITEPTTGRVRLRGRVASLLEVGTGFHPELTGRENIYLNGAVLGMMRQEIDRKFDEIVAFAEVEKFLDTPVKRYSSGMYVRLAFAVAAHLEPEILVVDEVLAVGDAAFQKKCLGKMGDVASKEGRTVLFVSHNMAAITQLCSQGIIIDRGKIKQIGTPSDVIQLYFQSDKIEHGFVNLDQYQERIGNQQARFKWAKTSQDDGNLTEDFVLGDNLIIEFAIFAERQINNIKLAVQLRTTDGINICNMVDTDSNFHVSKIDGVQICRVLLQDLRLYPDTYYISLWAGQNDSIYIYDYVKDCLSFRIVDGGKLTMRKLPRSAGIFFFTPEWMILNEVNS